MTFFTKGVKLDLVAAVFATLYFRYMVVASGSVNTCWGTFSVWVCRFSCYSSWFRS